MNMRFPTSLALLGLLAGCGLSDEQGGDAKLAAAEQTMADDVALQLPADYRGFGPYMISDRLGQADQVIVLYANDTARAGARADGKLPSGSVIVGEIYKARTDGDGDVLTSALGRRVPGELATIVMMERQAGYGDRYPEGLKVGDWEFEVFSPSGENLNKDTTACRECHEPLGDTEHTFSYEHLAAAN